MSDVIRLVSNNVPNSCTATYHLLQKRIDQYQLENKKKNKMADNKANQISSQPALVNKQQSQDPQTPVYKATNNRTTVNNIIKTTQVNQNKQTAPSRDVKKETVKKEMNSNNKGKNIEDLDSLEDLHIDLGASPSTSKTTAPPQSTTTTTTKVKTSNNESESKPISNNHTNHNLQPSSHQGSNANNRMLFRNNTTIGKVFSDRRSGVEGKGEKKKEGVEQEERDDEDDVKVFSLTKGNKGNTPRNDAFFAMKENRDPVFHRPLDQPRPIDLPAIVSRQNTEDNIRFGTLVSRPKTYANPGAVTVKTEPDSSSGSSAGSHSHQSTCSNPAQSKQLPVNAVEKGCVSDPATRKERKSAFTRPPAKKMVIDAGHYERYARDKNGNVIASIPANGKSFPSVTSSSVDHAKLISANNNNNSHRLNLIYPSYGSKTAGVKRFPHHHHHGLLGTGPRGPGNGLPITHHKTLARPETKPAYSVTSSRLTGMVRNSLDNAFTTTKLRTDIIENDDDKVMELKLGGADKLKETQKVALPHLSPPTPRKQQFL